MQNSRPISALRNYTDVLNEVEENRPVYLTRNGREEYVVVKLEEYNHLKATLRLLTSLEAGEHSSREKGWLSAKNVKEQLGI